MKELPPRIARKIAGLGQSGCWVWTGSITTGGYGNVYYEGRVRLAHRVVYELLVGPIPAGLQLDHQCHNVDATCRGGVTCEHRRCMNPDHLGLATNRENGSRGRVASVNRARQLSKTECKRGHPLSGANVAVDSVGARRCRTCAREKSRRREGRSGAPAQVRGPLRKVVVRQGRRAVLECHHEAMQRGNGPAPKRMRCAACDQTITEGKEWDA